MDIIISDYEKITYDGNQYILRELVTRKKRDSEEKYDVWIDRGYFGDLSGALRDLIRIRVGSKQSTVTLRKYLDEYKNVTEEICGLVSGVDDPKTTV